MDNETLLKAQQQLEGEDIYTTIRNGTLYVLVGDVGLELAEYEINYRAKIWDDEYRQNMREDLY